VYNHFLNEKQTQYKETKSSDNYNTQQSKLTQLRKTEEYNFLSEMPLQVLQASLRNMHTAFDRFYKHKGGYPNYKSKRDKQAFKIAQPNTFHIKDNKLHIPKLKTGIKCKVSKELIGEPCFTTITKTKSGKYFVSITVRQDNYKPYPHTNKSVGLDLGIKDLVITSDGVKYPRLKKQIKQLKCKLKHNQRYLSRKQHGSKRYEKQVLKCNRIYEKITNVKVDYIHKITTELVKTYDIIKVEDLNIKGMVKNHKLAEVINECNWSVFVNMLQYKCDWNNKQLVKVDRFYPSSQICSECGCKNKKVKNLAIRQWTCECCGSKHDRDVNAAINILRYNSVRNTEYSRGGVNKPNGTTCSTSDCLDYAKAIGEEAITELEVLQD
jgi:putative transposase